MITKYFKSEIFSNSNGNLLVLGVTRKIEFKYVDKLSLRDYNCKNHCDVFYCTNLCIYGETIEINNRRFSIVNENCQGIFKRECNLRQYYVVKVEEKDIIIRSKYCLNGIVFHAKKNKNIVINFSKLFENHQHFEYDSKNDCVTFSVKLVVKIKEIQKSCGIFNNCYFNKIEGYFEFVKTKVLYPNLTISYPSRALNLDQPYEKFLE